MKAMNRLYAGAIAALLAATVACTPDRLSDLSAYHTLDPESGWAYGDTLRYTLRPDSAEVTGSGSLILGLRHTASYPYDNLWLELSYAGPDSVTMVRDTFNISLADNNGKWRGAGPGTSIQLTDTLLRNFTVPDGPLNLRHVMRTPAVEQIEQVGLIFTK